MLPPGQGLGNRCHCSYSVFKLGPNASSTMASTVRQAAQSTEFLIENTVIHQERHMTIQAEGSVLQKG